MTRVAKLDWMALLQRQLGELRDMSYSTGVDDDTATGARVLFVMTMLCSLRWHIEGIPND